MARKRSWIKSLSRRKKFLFLGLSILIAFLAWFVIRYFTLDTNLSVINLYQFPDAVKISDIEISSNNKFAIAIDGKITRESDNELRPTASTAKMILGLAIMRARPFELGNTGETITLTQDDYNRYAWYVENGGSTTSVQIGEKISEYDALVSVFLASSNNMADTLANWAFGSHEAYQNYANEMLREWGISNTVIGSDASGFSDSTKSTAGDLALIAYKLLENPVLAEIVSTKSYNIPVAGEIHNTNKLLGIDNIVGVKTGYIGDASGYCLITGYKESEHIITLSLLDAKTREASFEESLAIIKKVQDVTKINNLVSEGEVVGYYDSWWTGKIPIKAQANFSELIFDEAEKSHELAMDEGVLKLKINNNEYSVSVASDEFDRKPTFVEKIKHIFGWTKAGNEITIDDSASPEDPISSEEPTDTKENKEESVESAKTQKPTMATEKFTNATSSNCTIKLGALMLINPNFTVEESFIKTRRGEMVSLSSKYGIKEGVAGNGDNLLDAEAAMHINDMINAYKKAYPGHTLETRSCFRSRGTNCGRLCAATGASDHHTGLTCDLLDPTYGTSLDTDTYDQHIDWQWLRANSYKYGFIDRFPEAWAGGSMDEPLNVDANGSTGLFETWHYRYVGVAAATEIATGKYNNGRYDSLEHYLKSRGLVKDLKNGSCE